MKTLGLVALIVTAIAACNTDDNTCPTCVGGGKTNPPDVYGGGCDASKTPAEGGCDVNDSGGVFVDAKSSGDGSKAAPFKTIQQGVDAAKSGKKNVFVCEGTYDQALVLTGSPTDGVVIHGGFSCATWAHAGTKVVITSTKGGVVLRSDGVAVALEDVELDAVDGKNPGDSSIVALSNGASAMTFRRCTLNAGKGASGSTGSTDASDPGTAPAGNDGPKNMKTTARVCQCGALTTTGGEGSSAFGNLTVAGGGLPFIPNAPMMSGAPGFNGPACNAGGDGKDGASAPTGTAGGPAKTLGILSANGWAPDHGGDGVEGTPSQGGGGGGLAMIGGPEWQAGGGGCGGCSGHKGGGGGGGGGSIGVIAINSLVRLQSSTLLTSAGGAGGLGGAGQGGQRGGPGGLPSMAGACTGGKGGDGPKGGDGGGGPGGVSIGVAWAGTAPDLTGGTITLGAFGKGANGALDGVAVKDRAF